MVAERVGNDDNAGECRKPLARNRVLLPEALGLDRVERLNPPLELL